MGQLNLQIPVVGQPDSTEDPKVASNFTAVQAVINGGLDGTNLSAALAQSAAVNQAGQTVKGAVNISTSQSTTSTTYTTLATPDQVTGIVLPTNGLIRVRYQAMWQSTVANASRAAIFLGSNQLKVQTDPSVFGFGPATQAAVYSVNTGTTNANVPLFSAPVGLVSPGLGGAYNADVTTGQVFGAITSFAPNISVNDSGATAIASASVSVFPNAGGICEIIAAAGTYTVSVQFKTASGTVTVSNRRLFVEAWSPA